MTFTTRDTYSIETDAEADTVTLLQRPSLSSSSSVFNNNDIQNKSRFTTNNNHHHDDDETRCCGYLHRFERQLTTPTKFSIHNDGAEWLRDFEDIARANNWNSKDKFDIVRIYFDDKSTKTWFRETEDEFENDFENFKLAFLTRFSEDSKDKVVEMEVEKNRKGENLKGFLGLMAVCSPFIVMLIIILSTR